MSKIKTILGLYLILFAFAVMSCDNEPVDPIDFPPPVEEIQINVIGSYKLIAVNTTTQTDLDVDGVFSTNQMDETTCYLANSLEMKNDNTFTETDRGIEIVKDENNVDLLDCYIRQTISGTWVLEGKNVTLTYVKGGEQYSKKYLASENMLTYIENNAKVVATNSSGNPIYITSNITKVYTKQK